MAVSKSLRYQVLRRDNHTCRYCGRAAPEVRLTVDHVVPEALGGADTPENLVAACSDCNSGKSATPPEAATVAQVQDDALRWAEALHAAAQDMVADVERRNRVRDQFEQAWNRWKWGDVPAPLPANWRDTVDTFTAVGLPMPVLMECIDIAMGRSRVDRESKFRYMCGVAWKRVSELQAAARNVAGETVVAAVHTDQALTDLMELLFGLFPWCDDAEEHQRLIGEFDERHADDEFEDGTPCSYATWSSDAKVFAASVERACDALWWLESNPRMILAELEEGLRGQLLAESERQHYCAGELPGESSVYRYALHLLAKALPDRMRAPKPEERQFFPEAGSEEHS